MTKAEIKKIMELVKKNFRFLEFNPITEREEVINIDDRLENLQECLKSMYEESLAKREEASKFMSCRMGIMKKELETANSNIEYLNNNNAEIGKEIYKIYHGGKK
jgi:septation ring formation regulator EzrA